MLWLSRPPYLRWFAAVAIVLAAFVWDLSGRQTASYPFAAVDLGRGRVLSDDTIVWKAAPSGVFSVPDLSDATAAIDIAKGDPITRSVLSPTISIPDGWWSVPIALPQGAFAGATIRVVLPNGEGVSGVVVQAATSDSFGSLESAAVAFPGGVAELVAQVSALGELVVLIEP
jgi:hypothetical protein